MILTVCYSLMSLATFALVVCMLQDTMTGSHWLFRFFMVMLMAGCLSTAISVFLPGEAPNIWHLLRGSGLLGVLAMMRLRQVQWRVASAVARGKADRRAKV